MNHRKYQRLQYLWQITWSLTTCIVVVDMALSKAVFVNRFSTLLTRVAGSSASERRLSNYYPIDEHIFGLSEEQKLVIKLLYVFCNGNLQLWWRIIVICRHTKLVVIYRMWRRVRFSITDLQSMLLRFWGCFLMRIY